MGYRDFWGDVHYRRSLASRVTLLTTMAVGIAVTGVAFAAYATVRMQSMESIDRSLHAPCRGRRRPRAGWRPSSATRSPAGPWARET